MGFDNYYPNRKDRRKPYRRSARFDYHCRPHGGCGWCEGNRIYRTLKANIDAKQQMMELKHEEQE